MKNFWCKLCLITLALLLPSVAHGVGLVTVYGNSNSPVAMEMYGDNTANRFLVVDLKASSEEDLQVNVLKFKFISLENSAPVQPSEMNSFKLFYYDGKPMDTVGRTIGSDGIVAFYPGVKILKANRISFYIEARFAPTENNKLIQATFLPSRCEFLGLTSNQLVVVSGSDLPGAVMRLKGGLPDLYVKSLTWTPAVIRQVDPSFFGPAKVLTQAEKDSLKIEFKLKIGNSGKVLANLKDSSFSLDLGALGNRLYTYNFTNITYVPYNGETEFKFTLGSEYGLLQFAGVKDLFVRVDDKGDIREANEDNNWQKFEMKVWGYDKLQVQLSPKTLARGDSVLAGTKGVDIARFNMIATDSTYGFDLNSLTIKLEGCGTDAALKNIKLVDKFREQELGVFASFPKSNWELKFPFVNPFHISPLVFADLTVRADIEGLCVGEMMVGISKVETTADTSKAFLPLWSNPIKTIKLAVVVPIAPKPVEVPKEIKNEPPVVIIPKEEVKAAVQEKIFAYGKPRVWLALEKQKAEELKLELLKLLKRKTLPMPANHWFLYVNAYIYGGYSPAEIMRSVQLGGKIVHPSIPQSAWKNSKDYKENIK